MDGGSVRRARWLATFLQDKSEGGLKDGREFGVVEAGGIGFHATGISGLGDNVGEIGFLNAMLGEARYLKVGRELGEPVGAVVRAEHLPDLAKTIWGMTGIDLKGMREKGGAEGSVRGLVHTAKRRGKAMNGAKSGVCEGESAG